MTEWVCPKCGFREAGPMMARHKCRKCEAEMAPVTLNATEDEKKKEKVLERLED